LYLLLRQAPTWRDGRGVYQFSGKRIDTERALPALILTPFDLPSTQVERILGYKISDEVTHRDDVVRLTRVLEAWVD